jgi:peptide subunit release factor RF-3
VLKDCETGLQQALSIFKVPFMSQPEIETEKHQLQVQPGFEFLTTINDMQKNMHEKHQEIMALISACSTRASSVCNICHWLNCHGQMFCS